jgi:hypothetical protein
MIESVMLASTVFDLLAVAGLGWLVRRSGQERDAALGEQRAALESLRTDLGQLVRDAEARARSLDETLAAREQRLRALLRDTDPAETMRRPVPAMDFRRSPGPDDEAAAAARRPGADPAEARLLRDLQVSFAPRRA